MWCLTRHWVACSLNHAWGRRECSDVVIAINSSSSSYGIVVAVVNTVL